ncbi:unnamed protein product [Amoebophrya sp. A120]|nr:unnamed protein product [Amoebophrya sp. A120]|eukprot:GSA120T00000316001.1
MEDHRELTQGQKIQKHIDDGTYQIWQTVTLGKESAEKYPIDVILTSSPVAWTVQQFDVFDEWLHMRGGDLGLRASSRGTATAGTTIHRERSGRSSRPRSPRIVARDGDRRHHHRQKSGRYGRSGGKDRGSLTREI